MDLIETEANNVNSLICFLMPGTERRTEAHPIVSGDVSAMLHPFDRTRILF